MGFWSLISGSDLEAAQTQGDALDKQLAALNKADLAKGTLTQAQYDTAMADAAKGATGNVTDQVQGAFVEGAKEGLQNLGDGIQNVTSFTLGGIFKLIPWQVWVFGAIALFVWMGGLPLLKGSLSTLKKRA